MHFLLTGHTGFKGAWFILLLRELGHDVSGLALDPLVNSLYSDASLTDLLHHDFRIDIRDPEAVSGAVRATRPDVVVHFAAQSLVKESYRAPEDTFSTNVSGTLNILSSSQELDSVGQRLIVTSDKVYRNNGRHHPYTENDELGGRDPYSASKAMADLLTQSWVHSFPGAPTAIARAGNVIGGGDVTAHRLIPDWVRSYKSGAQLQLRHPAAIRPWQHVLDCLNGYLAILGNLDSSSQPLAWNVGPDPSSVKSVREVVEVFSSKMGANLPVTVPSVPQEHEEEVLTLNSDLLRAKSGWENKLNFIETIEWTAQWEASAMRGENPLHLAQSQVREFLERPAPGR